MDTFVARILASAAVSATRAREIHGRIHVQFEEVLLVGMLPHVVTGSLVVPGSDGLKLNDAHRDLLSLGSAMDKSSEERSIAARSRE